MQQNNKYFFFCPYDTLLKIQNCRRDRALSFPIIVRREICLKIICLISHFTEEDRETMQCATKIAPNESIHFSKQNWKAIRCEKWMPRGKKQITKVDFSI